MRGWLARLLEHGNRRPAAAVLLLQLRQPQRRGHPGGAAADDEDVDVERFARHQVFATKDTKESKVTKKDSNNTKERLTGPFARLVDGILERMYGPIYTGHVIHLGV